MTISSKSLLIAIVAYQKVVSPFLPRSCRFYPSCSCYAVRSIERHGAVKGSLLAIKRLSRCHPWGAGGYDPVA